MLARVQIAGRGSVIAEAPGELCPGIRLPLPQDNAFDAKVVSKRPVSDCYHLLVSQHPAKLGDGRRPLTTSGQPIDNGAHLAVEIEPFHFVLSAWRLALREHQAINAAFIKCPDPPTKLSPADAE